MSTLDDRIDALESRAAMEELRSRYASYATRGDAAGVPYREQQQVEP
jgi:hypothetical protein